MCKYLESKLFVTSFRFNCVQCDYIVFEIKALSLEWQFCLLKCCFDIMDLKPHVAKHLAPQSNIAKHLALKSNVTKPGSLNFQHMVDHIWHQIRVVKGGWPLLLSQTHKDSLCQGVRIETGFVVQIRGSSCNRVFFNGTILVVDVLSSRTNIFIVMFNLNEILNRSNLEYGKISISHYMTLEILINC